MVGLVLTAVLVLSLPASAVGTVGAQTAGNDAPMPVLDAPETIERGQLYELDGGGSTGEIAAYRWDYNPNAPTEYQRSSTESTIYARDRTGDGQDQFTVRLGVVDDEGNVAWDEETITVTESEPPNASIASSDDFTVEREQWERTDGGSWFNSTSTDNQGIRSCKWTFEYGPTVERHSGDGLGWGAGSTECRKNFSYAVPGTYDVTLTVEDWAGNSDETTRTVEVVPKEPVTDDPQPNAELSGPDQVEWGATYWLNASNSTSEADVRYYIAETNPDVWKDDERNLGHQTYYGSVYDGQFDTIDVAVGVLTVDDQVDWAWKTIDIIEPEKPDAAISGPDAVATGDWGTFDASNSTDNDRIRAYNWTIRNESGAVVDRGVRAGSEYSYHFEEPGEYTVTVSVGDWVNIDRDEPAHYGVASQTVTVSEDGTVDGGDSGDEAETEVPDETESPEETDAPDDADPPENPDPPENSDPPEEDDGSSGDDDASDDTSSSPSAPSGDGGGDGGSGGGAPPSDADESDATVDVERINASTSVVDVSGAPDGAAVDVDLDANASGDAVAYEGLVVHTDGNDSVSLTVRAHADEPDSVTADDVAGFDALSSLTVDGTESLDGDEAAVRFRVAKDRLDAADADPEHVTLWRDVDGGSDAVETTVVNETDDTYVYRAEASAAPVYTVGVERPVVTVTDLAVTDDEPMAGDTVDVTATVANTGEVAGTTNVSLAVDGETVDGESRTVEVGPRSSETVTFSVPVEAAGEQTLTAGDASTTLSVAAQAPATETAESTTGATSETDDGETPGTSFGGVTGAGAVLVLVGIAGAALLAYRQ
ncbi:PGF-pre-PGF domain-containing protein [Halomicrobium zhouii]|uniref:PGF-pre-PGF domain-containing protein n=1 Tax=Halomicrobium zhouii TaxID=767519 RepID=A0A1I6MBC9_9EURY|nr:PGF-pre-PGF domain-containing protein [Halomicrobium zhouii]